MNKLSNSGGETDNVHFGRGPIFVDSVTPKEEMAELIKQLHAKLITKEYFTARMAELFEICEDSKQQIPDGDCKLLNPQNKLVLTVNGHVQEFGVRQISKYRQSLEEAWRMQYGSILLEELDVNRGLVRIILDFESD